VQPVSAANTAAHATHPIMLELGVKLELIYVKSRVLSRRLRIA